VLLNDTPEDGHVACDSKCFAEMGFTSSGQSFAVRDIVMHAGLPSVTAGGGLSVAVPANGTSVFVTITPSSS